MYVIYKRGTYYCSEYEETNKGKRDNFKIVKVRSHFDLWPFCNIIIKIKGKNL